MANKKNPTTLINHVLALILVFFLKEKNLHNGTHKTIYYEFVIFMARLLFHKLDNGRSILEEMFHEFASYSSGAQ